jgi:hypothetical protein
MTPKRLYTLKGFFSTFFSAAGDPGHHSGMQLSLLRTGDGRGAPLAYTGVNYGMSLSRLTPLDDGWHHVAAVFSANRGTLYVDGQYVNGLHYEGRAFNPDSILNNAVTHFGRAGSRLYANGDEQFIGQLDDIRIYSGGLTALQVGDQFNAGPSPLSAVPEPASTTLALLGLAALAGLRRLRQR